MLRHLIRVLVICAIAIMVLTVAAFADDQPASRAIQEEVWAIPVTLPTIAYVVRPVGNGPFPLVVMNHGVSLNQRERGFFPLVEFRDAAMWFAPQASKMRTRPFWPRGMANMTMRSASSPMRSTATI